MLYAISLIQSFLESDVITHDWPARVVGAWMYQDPDRRELNFASLCLLRSRERVEVWPESSIACSLTGRVVAEKTERAWEGCDLQVLDTLSLT